MNPNYPHLNHLQPKNLHPRLFQPENPRPISVTVKDREITAGDTLPVPAEDEEWYEVGGFGFLDGEGFVTEPKFECGLAFPASTSAGSTAVPCRMKFCAVLIPGLYEVPSAALLSHSTPHYRIRSRCRL